MARRAKWKVAFDLGSRYSSYAYCMDNGEITVGGPWKPFFGPHYPKTLTALLYDESGEVAKYGFGALKELDAGKARFYFENFKKKADEHAVSTLDQYEIILLLLYFISR